MIVYQYKMAPPLRVRFLYHGVGILAVRRGHVRCCDDQRDTRPELKAGLFCPQALLAEMPAVITCSNDDHNVIYTGMMTSSCSEAGRRATTRQKGMC